MLHTQKIGWNISFPVRVKFGWISRNQVWKEAACAARFFFYSVLPLDEPRQSLWLVFRLQNSVVLQPKWNSARFSRLILGGTCVLPQNPRLLYALSMVSTGKSNFEQQK